jgi:L-ascorbate metabolism protein UlaG (beta-lactamase superfamily)
VTATGQLEWFGCSTFRVTLDDLVVFLDAYLDRAPTARPTGLGSADVQTADWILIGHSHWDHLYGAQTIAANTGATIVGSYETARVMAELGVPESQLLRVAGGERVRLREDVSVRVLPSLHSAVWSHRCAPAVDDSCIGHLGVAYQDQLLAMNDLTDWVRTLGPDVLRHLGQTSTGAHGDGGTLSYLIEHPGGTVLFQDSAGCWTSLLADIGRQVDVAILAAAGRPCCDGEPWQGTMLEFLAKELELLAPESVVLCHHDDFLPGFSRSTDVGLVEAHLRSAAPATRLLTMEYGQPKDIFTSVPG